MSLSYKTPCFFFFLRYLYKKCCFSSINSVPCFSGTGGFPHQTSSRENADILESEDSQIQHAHLGTRLRLQRVPEKRPGKYYVPCPYCGHYQIVVYQQIVVPKEDRDPGRILDLKIACPIKIDAHTHLLVEDAEVLAALIKQNYLSRSGIEFQGIEKTTKQD